MNDQQERAVDYLVYTVLAFAVICICYGVFIR